MRVAGRPSFAGKAAIVGVGYTKFSRESGRSVLELATEAVEAALTDAGLERGAVDGLLSYHLGDSVPVAVVARTLGLKRFRWHNDYFGGGSQCASILGDAAMAIDAGLADSLVIYRALNGRSGKRMGQVGQGGGDSIEEQFLTPYGLRGPVQMFALAAQHTLARLKVTTEQLGELVVRQRAKAVLNPKALLREPLSLSEYLASPPVATPLRRHDCCLETDAACAIVITGASQAKALRHRPVYVQGAVRAGGPGVGAMDEAGMHPFRIFSHYVAPALYEQAGVGARDIDLFQLYDAYSFLILQQLEDFGAGGGGGGGGRGGGGRRVLSAAFRV
jgi:acetyl-CoA acetyltransferase